ncbi:MAG: heme-binding protein [Chitinophagia bacterium]
MKIFYILSALAIIIIAFQSFRSFSASSIETQKYRVVKKEEGFEIRFYPKATFATIRSTGTNYKQVASSGFRKLAGYIFGGNDQNKSIAMTAPVRMEMSEKGSAMSFVMPEKYDMASLPKPKDATVEIKQSSEVYAAVIAFGGYANDEKINDYTNKLVALLQKKNIKIIGGFNFLGYNAPYEFIGRKNEISIPIEWKE